MKLGKIIKLQINMVSVIVRNLTRGVVSSSPNYQRINVNIRYLYSSIFIAKMEDINQLLYMAVDLLKKYPNTFLLLFTMLSVIKIYLKLNKILSAKMISKDKKDDK
jgi:hypothetical protein